MKKDNHEPYVLLTYRHLIYILSFYRGFVLVHFIFIVTCLQGACRYRCNLRDVGVRKFVTPSPDSCRVAGSVANVWEEKKTSFNAVQKFLSVSIAYPMIRMYLLREPSISVFYI
jgi:hypothetical protein